MLKHGYKQGGLLGCYFRNPSEWMQHGAGWRQKRWEKWTDTGYVLKVEPTGWIGCEVSENKGSCKSLLGFWPEYQKDGVVFN